MAGSLNIVPLVSGIYTPAAPSVDDYGDGDFVLDLNSSILYGPKDSSSGYVWPTSSRFSQQIIWQGPWGYPSSYTPGDVVSSSGTQYLCVKPVVIYPTTISVGAVGSWVAGTYAVYSSQLYLCLSDTTTNPSGGFAGGWLAYDPGADWNTAQTLGTYGSVGNWLALDPSVQVDTTVSGGTMTRFQAVIGTTNITDAAVTNAKLYKVSGSEAVSTGAIRDLAVTDAKLSTTGVAAGNYPLVTVNTKGRVTAGTTLAATDITAHASRHGLLGADPITGITYLQLSLGSVTTNGNTPYANATDKIVSASSTASSQPIAQAMPTGGFSANKMEDLWADPFAHSRASECSTMPRISAFSNLGLVSGNAYATRCVYTGNQASHTFSNIRCAVSAVGTGVTKFVLFVLDSTGTLVPNGYTIDTLGITAGAMTVGVVSGALNASIVLTPGAVYYLGIGAVFTTGPSPKGTSVGTGMAGIVPQLGRSGAYTTGAPASLSSLGSSASLPWVELY